MGDASVAQEISTLNSPRSSTITIHGGGLQEGHERVQSIYCEEMNSVKPDDVIFLGKEPQRPLLVFPEGELDAVGITNKDMEGLQPTRFLSGNIIDFYIKYLQTRLSSTIKDQTHFFNSFFSTKLTEKSSESIGIDHRKLAFANVRKWTQGVNLFEKAFVFIPVHGSEHWSVIILCHLNSLISLPDGHKSLPCILHLDSVEGQHRSFEEHIRSYVALAWIERYQESNRDQLLALCSMKYEQVKVPQQDNNYDCGIYLLHYIELFLTSLDLKFAPSEGILKLWETSEVSDKRMYIKNLIQELSLIFRLQQKRNSLEHQTLRTRCTRLESQVLQPRLRDEAVSKRLVQDVQNNGLKKMDGQAVEHIGPLATSGIYMDIQQQNSDEIEHSCLPTVDGNPTDIQQLDSEEIEHAGPSSAGGIPMDIQQENRESIDLADPPTSYGISMDIQHDKEESEHAGLLNTGGISTDIQQHGNEEIEYAGPLSTNEISMDIQQREPPSTLLSKPLKGRKTRRRNWTKDETDLLLRCKVEGGPFCMGNQGWNAIS